ncbi:MAG: L,D-transpeptidase family protein [Pseudobdellovibrionaceae bacterium]
MSPGGEIFIHGLPDNSLKRAFINHPKNDWTRGCVAVTDEEIEEIWEMVQRNTPIELCP